MSRRILHEESTSTRATADIQHPLGWVPFEVNSPINLNEQLSILQNWTSRGPYFALMKHLFLRLGIDAEQNKLDKKITYFEESHF